MSVAGGMLNRFVLATEHTHHGRSVLDVRLLVLLGKQVGHAFERAVRYGATSPLVRIDFLALTHVPLERLLELAC